MLTSMPGVQTWLRHTQSKVCIAEYPLYIETVRTNRVDGIYVNHSRNMFRMRDARAVYRLQEREQRHHRRWGHIPQSFCRILDGWDPHTLRWRRWQDQSLLSPVHDSISSFVWNNFGTRAYPSATGEVTIEECVDDKSEARFCWADDSALIFIFPHWPLEHLQGRREQLRPRARRRLCLSSRRLLIGLWASGHHRQRQVLCRQTQRQRGGLRWEIREAFLGIFLYVRVAASFFWPILFSRAVEAEMAGMHRYGTAVGAY